MGTGMPALGNLRKLPPAPWGPTQGMFCPIAPCHGIMARHIVTFRLAERTLSTRPAILPPSRTVAPHFRGHTEGGSNQLMAHRDLSL